MALPVVTCGADVVLSYSVGTQNANLSVSATGAPTSYTWTVLSVPPGSTALSEVRGSFTNGIASGTSPTFVTDAALEGTYVIQCIATNAEGDSIPSTDVQGGQQNVVVKTLLLDLALPNDYQYDWADYANNTLSLLETAAAAGGTHAFAGANHTVSTLAEVNTKISDATLIDTTDSRLSDSRTPSAHTTSHQHSGTDEVATATPAANAIPKAGAAGTLDAGWIPAGVGVTDHGALTGLSDDDHSQYHNDTRGDARYYTETELDAGQLDNRYYTESEVDIIASGINHGDLENIGTDDHHAESHTVASHSDTTATGTELETLTDGSDGSSLHNHGSIYYTETELDAGQLDNRYYTETEADVFHNALDAKITASGVTNGDSHDHSGGDGAQIDHGGLAGLTDDDHSQYHNDTRGDTRYFTKTELGATTSGTSGSSLIGIPVLGSPTFTTQADSNNLFSSTGRATGGEITSAGGTIVTVAAGSGFIKAHDDDTDIIYSFDWPASGIDLSGDVHSYIGVEYNNGSPQVVARTSENWDKDTDFSLGHVVNEAGSLHILNNPWWVTDGITNVIEKLECIGHVVRDNSVGGLTPSVTGTRSIAVSAGTLWSRLNENEIPAIDTNVTGTVELYWVNSSDVWTDSDISQYPVTHWNDTTLDALQTFTNNWYGNFWIYAEADDKEIGLIYPQAQYANLASAEAEAPPSKLPPHILEHGLLIGRITVKEGVDAAAAVQSAFDTQFSLAAAADHGNLAGLADDDHTQYHTDARGDARYSNLAHAARHNAGGADAMAIDAAAGTGSLRTLGTSATAAAAGNDSRLSDDRVASGIRTATTIVSTSAATAPTTGQVLKATGDSGATWQAASPLTTKGDLYGYSTTDARIPIGTEGQIPVVRSGESTGIGWEDRGAFVPSVVGLEALAYTPGGNRDLDSADSAFETLGTDEADKAEGTFVVPYTGDYNITFRGGGFQVLGATDVSIEWQLLFDEAAYGGWVAQTVSDSWKIFYQDDGEYHSWSFHGTVTLEAGTHKVAIQGKQLGGAGTFRCNTNNKYTVVLDHASGSGLGGVIVDEQTNATDVGSIAATPIVITTHSNIATADETILLTAAMPYIVLTNPSTQELSYRIDAGSWVSFAQMGHDTNYVLGIAGAVSISMSAGSHTIDVGLSTGNDTLTMRGSTDWPAKSSVWRFRGGFIPYYDQTGTLIQDTPVAIYAGDGIDFIDNSGNITISGVSATENNIIAMEVFS